MQIILRPFFDDNILAPQSSASLSALKDAVSESMAERQEKRDAIKVEIDSMLSHLGYLVEAEKDYHRRIGILQDRTVDSLYGSTSALEYAPGLVASHKDVQVQRIDPRVGMESSPVSASSVPIASVGVIQSLELLDDVDRNVRLYSHRVKWLRLRIQQMLVEIEKLDAENKKTGES